MEALDTLITSVPEWHTLLDNLNGKISSRQIELAQIGGYRTPVPSLKNKGSTESLRPNDSTKSPIQEDIELQVSSELPPNKTRRLESPVLSASEGPPLWNPTKAAVFPPLISHSSSPGPAAASQRRTSNQIAGDALVKPILLPLARKRKTASVASNDSQGPKYRTRSMIIVYYDSEVQHAFEELARYISSCRNGMRKGKMAARMADRKRMADLETGSSDEEDSKPNGLPTLDNKLVTSFTGGSAPAVDLRKDTLKVDGDDDIEHPKLQYISTRRMGPPAAQKNAPPTNGGTSLPQIPGNLRSNGWKRSGIGHGASSTPTSIYDELDAGLELCQSMCEDAAHQFLRDGDCSVEIAGINRRLKEVKETTEKHQKQTPKPKSEADAKPLDSGTPEIPLSVKYDGPVGGQSLTVRSSKPAQMCRTLLVQSTPPKIPGRIEVDEDIRYDEEDDCQDLIWRSTRNIGGHYNQIETITTLA